MEKKPAYFKYCIVSSCKNSTVKAPDKIFILLPEDKNRRTKWLKACRKNEREISLTSKCLHVCEDHFNLEEDMDNYMKFKLMGGKKKMKPNVVPHIFNCQLAKGRIVEDVAASTSKVSTGNPDNMYIDTVSVQPVQTFSATNYYEEFLATTVVIDKKNVSTQARPKFRSKSIQCNMHKWNLDQQKKKQQQSKYVIL